MSGVDGGQEAELELVIEGDTTPTNEDDKTKADPPSNDDDGDDDDDDNRDDRLAVNEDEDEDWRNETADERRERRRQEKREKKRRRQDYTQADHKLIDQLSETVLRQERQLYDLTGRTILTDANQLEQQRDWYARRATGLRQKKMKALADGDANAAFQFESQEQEAIQKAAEFGGRIQHLQQQAHQLQQRQQQAQNQLSPRAEQLATVFTSRFPWYGQPGYEQETRRVMHLESMLAASGSDINSPNHWRTLERKMADVLPEDLMGGISKASAQPKPERQPARGGPPVAGRADPPKAGPNQLVVTREAKEILIQAGLLPDDGKMPTDPKKRADLIEVVKQINANLSKKTA